MNDVKPTIWILADERAGNNNQAIGVAEALGFPFEIKQLVYNKCARLPNFIRGASLRGIDPEKSATLAPDWPDMVFSAGRKTAPVARYIKKQSGSKTRLIHFMWPGFPAGDFDLIAVPEHDNIPQKGNVVLTTGAPNRVNAAMLQEAREKWLSQFAYLPAPRIALLLGGSTKKNTFTEQHAYDLAKKASIFMSGKRGSFLVTTSRRTSDEAARVLKHNLRAKFYFHNYKTGGENPFLGFLAVCDAIIVSGDSISMCSEACSTGKPVYIYAPDDLIPEKHQRFVKNLYAHNNAKPLGRELSTWKYTPLEDTAKIAALIREKYC